MSLQPLSSLLNLVRLPARLMDTWVSRSRRKKKWTAQKSTGMSPHSWNVGTSQDHHHQAYLLSEWKYRLSLSEKDSTDNLHHLYYAESIRIPQLLIKPNKKSFERKTSSCYEDPLLFMESSNLDGTCIKKRREPTLTCQSLMLPVTQINQLNEFTLEHYSNKKIWLGYEC